MFTGVHGVISQMIEIFFSELACILAFQNMLPVSAIIGFEFLTAVVIKSSIFWDITPCSPLKVNRRFGETCRTLIATCFDTDFMLGLFFDLADEVKFSSETSVDDQRSILCYILEIRALQISY
jgi:hypothetical protein